MASSGRTDPKAQAVQSPALSGRFAPKWDAGKAYVTTRWGPARTLPRESRPQGGAGENSRSEISAPAPGGRNPRRASPRACIPRTSEWSISYSSRNRRRNRSRASRESHRSIVKKRVSSRSSRRSSVERNPSPRRKSRSQSVGFEPRFSSGGAASRSSHDSDGFVLAPFDREVESHFRLELPLANDGMHQVGVPVAGDASVERERQGVDEARFSRARRAGENEEVHSLEVAYRELPIRGEAFELESNRAHGPGREARRRALERGRRKHPAPSSTRRRDRAANAPDSFPAAAPPFPGRGRR